MLYLLLGAICFAGIHLGVAGTLLRDRAIAAIGEGAYRAVFSIVSLAAIVWLWARCSTLWIMESLSRRAAKARTEAWPGAVRADCRSLN
jgi:uncharacterized membrane protein